MAECSRIVPIEDVDRIRAEALDEQLKAVPLGIRTKELWLNIVGHALAVARSETEEDVITTFRMAREAQEAA